MLQPVKPGTRHLTRTILTALIAVITLSLAAPVSAKEMTINLIGKDGTPLKIGTINITQSDQGETFKIKWQDDKFSEQFLSMRPFKCIDGDQMLCHLPYPYKTRGLIKKDDLMDLEYAFLFIHKGDGEYGINFWNGVYYRLERGPDGGFKGEVWETDMNELASPPEEEYGRPIGNDDLVRGAEGKHRFPTLEIR